MNNKGEQNLQKGTKDVNGRISVPVTGNFMDNILTNVKTQFRNARHHAANNMKQEKNAPPKLPIPPKQSNLEPEYLNNILIDLCDVNKLKNVNENKIQSKNTDRSKKNKIYENTKVNQEKMKHVDNNIDNKLNENNNNNKTEVLKRPKSSIKRRLQNLIENKKHIQINENTQKTSRITGKQPSREPSPKNVPQITIPEQFITNNTSTYIAECKKSDSKHRKTKKESKKKELKTNDKKSEQMTSLQENDSKNIKCKQKSKVKQKCVTNTTSPQTKQIQRNNLQSEHSNKIKLIVNQIASNLKQTSCFELKAGKIKRDMYIKRVSTCMTSRALEQINRILNPSHQNAINKIHHSGKQMLLCSKSNVNESPPEQSPKLITSEKRKSKSNLSHIENEINSFNKLQVENNNTQVKNDATENKIPPNAEQCDNAKKLSPDEQLIKKINDKIDKIIIKGLNSFEHIDTSTSSLNENSDQIKNDLQINHTSGSIDPVNIKPVPLKEPPRFMKAPNPKLIPSNYQVATDSDDSHIISSVQILTKVENLEILNNIKQTMAVLQKAKSAQTARRPVNVLDKPKTFMNIPKPIKTTVEITEKPNKIPEKIPSKMGTSETAEKQTPMQKTELLPTENLKKNISQQRTLISQKNAQKNNSSLLAIRKLSKNIEQNSTVPSIKSTSTSIGNRPTIVSTLINQNAFPASSTVTNRTNSSSTLNLIAALSSSKKIALLAPMEVVQDFVNLVNHAKRNRKTFTICGNFYSLRRAFAERGWIEKVRINIMEDRESWRKIESLSNFELVDGMRNKDFGEKYRRMFLTKLLAGHQVDFYWDYLTNPFSVNNDKVKRTLINRFPFGATRAYTSKYGLTESLRDAHWYCIDGYANIFYPRTYNLSMIEEMASFVEDFRITAVISLLQWIISNMTTPDKLLSATGDIPTSVYNFATIQCHNYIKIKEHRDIDEVIPQAKDYEWEVFLEKFYKIVHNESCFKLNDRVSAELMVEQSKYVIKKVKKYLPNLHLDGFKNMWLLKPNNGSRGSGIHVCRTLKYMMDTVNNKKDVKYVVQKYLERPLLIHKTKFDIRQWFLVTCMPNVKVWLYKECYLRFSSQMFDLNKLHESIHLTNNSIQCRYKNNNQRSTSLPDQNMWDSETFRKYLTEIGQPYTWRNIIYKGMKECLIGLFMLCQSKMELRINSFELCGADFMIGEDYRPYLIEINSRPALYPSTKITARMCPKVLEDVVKGLRIFHNIFILVTIDNARNPKAPTGDFELIYSDSFNYSIPRNVNSLYVEGMSYFTKYIDKTSSININTIIPITIPQVKEVKNDSIKKILNIDPGVVKVDVRNTLEKILAVVHEDRKDTETPEERNKQFRSMLSEFVNIISNVKNANESV